MRKLILVAVLTIVITPLFSQTINETIDNSIKDEVRLHSDVRLKYAHTSFSIDKYAIVDPYILIYSNTTANFYLVNQKEQLIVDHLDIFKTYPKIKPLDQHFQDKSGAKITLLSPFYNNGLSSGFTNLEKYDNTRFFAGLIKKKGKLYSLLVKIENDEIISTIVNYNIEEIFEKPTERNIELSDFAININLLRTSLWNNSELFLYALDPYVKKLPKNSSYAFETLFKNSIYQLKDDKISNLYKSKNSSKYYHNANYIQLEDKLLVLDNQKDSLLAIDKNYSVVSSIELPRTKLDTVSYNNKKVLFKDGYVIKDEFTEALYFILYNNKTYELFAISKDLSKITKIKSFVSELSLNKFKIHNGLLYFIVETNTSDPSKLFSYDLYNCGQIGDTVTLYDQTQKAISLFRGNLKREWFRGEYGMEHQKKEIYQLPSNGLQHKICKEKLSPEDELQQKSIESSIQLIGNLYNKKQVNKILSYLSCFDKFEYKILEKKIKEETFNSNLDSLFYQSELKDIFEYMSSPYFKYVGEMKTYHYELRTKNGWTLYFLKKENKWYLTSVIYKQNKNSQSF